MTGNPYSVRLQITRTTAARAICRFSTRMVAPRLSSWNFSVALIPSVFSLRVDGTKARQISRPATANGRDSHKLPYSPTHPMVKLGRYAPNTPMPKE